MIIAAPWNFAIAVIFCTIVLGLFLRFLFARQIANLQSHNGLLEAQLRQAEDKIDTLNCDIKSLKDLVTTSQAQ
jgi:hypothetical protein